jgi:hypothetical protein
MTKTTSNLDWLTAIVVSYVRAVSEGDTDLADTLYEIGVGIATAIIKGDDHVNKKISLYKPNSRDLLEAIIMGLAKSNELSHIDTEKSANEVALFILKELVGALLPAEDMSA